MRILGYIDHDRIKITVFEDNNKLIVQCEDGLCQQTYKFRNGGVAEDLASIKKLADLEFLSKIEEQLQSMRSIRQAALSRVTASFEEEFDTII